MLTYSTDYNVNAKYDSKSVSILQKSIKKGGKQDVYLKSVFISLYNHHIH